MRSQYCQKFFCTKLHIRKVIGFYQKTPIIIKVAQSTILIDLLSFLLYKLVISDVDNLVLGSWQNVS